MKAKTNIDSGFVKAKPAKNISCEVGSDKTGYIKFVYTLPADNKRKGYIIKIKEGGYPENENDGMTVYDDSNITKNAVTLTYPKTGFTDGTSYYVRIFTYTYKNADIVYTYKNAPQCTVIPIQSSGMQVFTTSGEFEVPAGVYSLEIFLVGGGGGGYQSESGWGGGGGGGYTLTKMINVQPGQKYGIIIGAGGAVNCNGGTTYFGEFYASGGISNPNGGNGGSGGGMPYGEWENYYGSYEGGCKGGSDGSNGYEGYSYDAGDGSRRCYSNRISTSTAYRLGQGKSTRAFGESNGTLYGGGGGGASKASYTYKGGEGGEGGGGKGSDHPDSSNFVSGATAGMDNSGGGGGGGNSKATKSCAQPGGSGIAIVRWGY